MILNKHKGDFMCCELVALNVVGGAEHAQWILLSSVKTSPYIRSLCAVSPRL